MLVINLKTDEEVIIGNARAKIMRTKGKSVTIAFDAPSDCHIHRVRDDKPYGSTRTNNISQIPAIPGEGAKAQHYNLDTPVHG